MLEFSRPQMLSSQTEVHDPSGRITTLDFTFWNRTGQFGFNGQRYECRRTAWGSTTAELTCEGHSVARSRRVGFFRVGFELSLAGGHYALRPAGFFESGMELYRGEDKLGGVFAQGWWRPKVYVRAPAEITVPEQVFLYWLVKLLWEAAQTAAIAAST